MEAWPGHRGSPRGLSGSPAGRRGRGVDPGAPWGRWVGVGTRWSWARGQRNPARPFPWRLGACLLRGKRERSDPLVCAFLRAALRLSVSTGSFTLVLPSRRAGRCPSLPTRFRRTRFLATARSQSCPGVGRERGASLCCRETGRLSCSPVAAAEARCRQLLAADRVSRAANPAEKLRGRCAQSRP